MNLNILIFFLLLFHSQEVDLKALRKRKAPSVQLWGKQLKKGEKKARRNDVLDVDDEESEVESESDEEDSELSDDDMRKVCTKAINEDFLSRLYLSICSLSDIN